MPSNQAECTEVNVSVSEGSEIRTSGASARNRYHRYLRRSTCERSTREAIFQHVPDAAHDEVLFRYVVYAFFTGWRDLDSGLRILDQAACEWIAGRELGNGYWAIDVIRHIESHLPGFEWEDYISTKRPRVIVRDGLPSALSYAVRADLETPVGTMKERVYILDGSAFDRTRKQVELRKEHYEGAMAQLDACPSETTRYIMARMNNRPPNLFTKMLRNMDRAKRYVSEMEIKVDIQRRKLSEHEIQELREEIRSYYLRTLRAIEDQPQPFYVPSPKGRTDRIFTYNPSVLQLPSAVRVILTDGIFHEVDLASAHLAISAWKWGCERLLAFLKDGGSVWKRLGEHFGLEGEALDVAKKVVFKPAVYSVVYGMEVSAIKGSVTRVLGAGSGQRFVEENLIAELIEAREMALEQIVLDGYGKKADGAKVDVTPEIDERSVLAIVNQSWEQALMRVVLEYEEEHHAEYEAKGMKPRFRVGLWQHDGAAIACSQRLGHYFNILDKRIRAEARLHGIPTRLTLDK